MCYHKLGYLFSYSFNRIINFSLEHLDKCTKYPIISSPSWVCYPAIFPKFVTSSFADSFPLLKCDQIFLDFYVLFGHRDNNLVVFPKKYLVSTGHAPISLPSCQSSKVTFFVASSQFFVMKIVINFVFLSFLLVLIFLKYQMQREWYLLWF